MEEVNIFDFFEGLAALILKGSPPLWYYAGRTGNKIRITTRSNNFREEQRVIEQHELVRLLRLKDNHFYKLGIPVNLTDK